MTIFDHESCFPNITTIKTRDELDKVLNDPGIDLKFDFYNFIEQWPNDKKFSLHGDISVWVDFETEQLIGVVRFSCPVLKTTEQSSNFTSIDPDGMLDPETPPTVYLNLVEEFYVNVIGNTIESQLSQLFHFYANELLYGTGELETHQTKRFTVVFDIGGRAYAKQGPERSQRSFLFPF